MILVGLAFKVSAAPFHMWTPDVYQGAPTPVTAFMSAATKVAALVLTLRLLVTAFPGEEELWTIALAVIVCISLAWGNLAALVQTDVKRMLAYSSISHAGFLLMPDRRRDGARRRRALLYYLMPYAAMSVGSFAIVAIRERELRQPVTVGSLAGFGWERPFLGRRDGRLHVRLHRPAAGRALPGQVLRLRRGGRPRLGVARRRGRRRDRRLDLLLPGRRPRDVHAAARAARRARRRVAAARPSAAGGRRCRARRHGRDLRRRRPPHRHRRRRRRVPPLPER